MGEEKGEDGGKEGRGRDEEGEGDGEGEKEKQEEVEENGKELLQNIHYRGI